MTLTARIFEAIKSSDAPVSVDAIMDLIPITVDKGTVAAIVSQRKKAGELVVTVDGGKACYSIAPGHDPATRRIAAKGAAPVRPKLSMTAPPVTSAWVKEEQAPGVQRSSHVTAPSITVGKAFERNRDTAQETLDLYVASVADPVILDALKGALNQAQRALDALNAGATT